MSDIAGLGPVFPIPPVTPVRASRTGRTDPPRGSEAHDEDADYRVPPPPGAGKGRLFDLTA
jgi:hypothetical protein